MTDLWYINIKNINTTMFDQLLQTLPSEMRFEIIRFRGFNDRCLKLFGKLMVKNYYLRNNLPFSWNNLSTTENGKPYYKLGKKFNISHSGDFVSVVFADNEVGVDIEKLGRMNLNEITEYLHPIESKFIENEENQEDAFYTVWTRKEAFLKAKGVGITKGLNNENCLEPRLFDKVDWYLNSLDFLPDYKIAICSQSPISEIQILELDITDFK